jgi:methionyl-tRNA formyltransferase
MDIVLFGEDVFTATVLQSLMDKNHNVLLIVCPLYSNNNHNRLQKIAEQNKIEFIREKDVNSAFIKKRLEKAQPDLLVSVHLRKILKKEIFSIPGKGAINVHPSLLPKYRGLSPQHQAFIHGDSESGVTVHFIEESVDTGGIIIQVPIPIDKDDYIFDFQFKMLEVYKQIVTDAIDIIADNKFVPAEQNNLDTSYFGSLKTKDREIDFTKTGTEAMNLIRAVSYPYKGAYYRKFKIWRAEIPDENTVKAYLKSHTETGIHMIDEEVILLRFNLDILISNDFEIIENEDNI